MRVVGRDEFLGLPAGTVFTKYDTLQWGELCIKCETIHRTDGPDDFVYQAIPSAIELGDQEEPFDVMIRASVRPERSVPMNFHLTERDGLFTQTQQFAVFELEDTRKLIERLQCALCTATLLEKLDTRQLLERLQLDLCTVTLGGKLSTDAPSEESRYRVPVHDALAQCDTVTPMEALRMFLAAAKQAENVRVVEDGLFCGMELKSMPLPKGLSAILGDLDDPERCVFLREPASASD